MRILAIDTSTAVLSTAVSEDDKIIIEYTQNKALTHSEKLMKVIDFVLQNIGLKLAEIDEFAVAVGPGSFTGIRIGVSVVNAFAMIKNKNVISVSTLRSIASNIEDADAIIIPTVYAQREDYYYSIYDQKGNTVYEIQSEDAKSIDEIIEEAKVFAKDRKVYLVGEIRDNEKIKKLDEKNIIIAKEKHNYTKASNLCFIAKEMLRNDEKQDKYAKPIYIRKSQAEVQYDERHGK